MDTITVNGYIPYFGLEDVHSLSEISDGMSIRNRMIYALNEAIDYACDLTETIDVNHGENQDTLGKATEVLGDGDKMNVFLEKLLDEVVEHLNEGKDMDVNFYPYYSSGQLQGYDFVLSDKEIDVDKLIQEAKREYDEREKRALIEEERWI